MASERPTGIATLSNVILILQGARLKLATGFNLFYDGLDKNNNPTSSLHNPVSYSWLGAISSMGQELKLLYKPGREDVSGSYQLLELLDHEVANTFNNECFKPSNQMEALTAIDLTLRRLTFTFQQALEDTLSL